MRAISQAVPVNTDGNPVRQLFVTRSRVLAQHVESAFRGLVDSTEIAFKTRPELQTIAEQARQRPTRTLAEFDNEIDLRDDLPAKFSALKDFHFPLFVSFDKLCSLLEGDLPSQDKKGRKIVVRRKIEFDDFREKYWPQFKRHLTSTTDPALVYSEIVGIIKGSAEALESPDGCLTRIQYTDCLYRRVSSQLTRSMRDTIYSIFEQYRIFKARQFEWDHADRTREILQNFKPKAPYRPVDYLYVPIRYLRFCRLIITALSYVDEVQDNLMLDIHLMRKLCRDIQGTYWGGDTAQTVVVGSAFRIKDLKTFVYEDIRESKNIPTWTSPSTLFSTFDLTVNFRSHSGIVDCAAFFVGVIYRLFPDSIDKIVETLCI
ncbi:hypothetical protein FRC12_014130 [Ceratobasidium sp. 428]|nr:hypothetical protein FRC12_014130 [Ceratobasidium sp. 428]